MPDREKVIKALETCSDVFYGAKGACSSCGYSQRDRCFGELVYDSISLLKEQEPVEPVKIGYLTNVPYPFRCGSCDTHIKNGQKFCDYCGQAVQWNDK